MNYFFSLAQPMWVNLLVLIPLATFLAFRKKRLSVTYKQILLATAFGMAFGYVEASVVVYLRSSLGLIVANSLPAAQFIDDLPKQLFTIEFFREAATLIMLGSVAMLTSPKIRERIALFLWIFAVWDIFYYVFLYLMIAWPSSLTTIDILFLIPMPWYAQVWFPLLVSIFTLTAIFACL